MNASKEALKEKPQDNLDAVIGRRIHMLMWDKGLTQKAVEADTAISQSSLAKKLRGQRGWAANEIVIMAEYLNTTVAYLFGETENPQPDKPTGGENVGGEGLEPPTLWVKDRELAPIIPLFAVA